MYRDISFISDKILNTLKASVTLWILRNSKRYFHQQITGSRKNPTNHF